MEFEAISDTEEIAHHGLQTKAYRCFQGVAWEDSRQTKHRMIPGISNVSFQVLAVPSYLWDVTLTALLRMYIR